MGRTLLALIVLGLVGWGGKWLYDSFLVSDPRTAPAVVPGSASEGAPGAPLGLRDPGTPPAAPSAPAGGSRPSSSEAPSPAAVEASKALRSLLAGGKALEAVTKALEAPPGLLRAPGVSAAALEAAGALADAPGAGPADRMARADRARRLLGRLFTTGAVSWEAVEARVGALNREVLHSGREVPGTLFRHTVRPGDTLDRLLRREWKGRVRAGHGLILHLNSIPSPDRLRAVPISVPEEPVRVLVSKSAHRLWILLGEVPLRTFPVGLGSNGRTPEGVFTVEELMPKPDYWPPEGGRVPYGDPRNPLGSRWIGFRDTPEAQGIGIHGTDDPSSIGRNMSQGCVRLLNGDVELLFDWVVTGCEVEVRR